MGRDKASLEIAGRALLVHVVDALAGCCAPIVIAARAGQELPSLGARVVERVDDPVEAGGPLVGIVAGLERLAERGASHVYLGACDAAAVTEDHARFMLEQLRARPELVAMVPCDGQGFVHPLASALVVGAMLERARAQLEAGKPKLQLLFRGPGIGRIPSQSLPDPAVLAPCNTPAQLQGLSAKWLAR